MSGRIIAIGDVHGCYAELDMLLEHLSPDPRDEVYLLGDLVNRGPDSHRVIQIARDVGATCLLGNHEQRLLNYFWLRDPLILKDYDRDTIDQLDDDDWEFLAHMKLFKHLPKYDTVLVHGGFLPGIPWNRQTVSIVTRIQVVDADGQPRKRSEAPQAPHWSTLWKGPPFVVYGHTPSLSVRQTEWTLCLDTGCAHGGRLSAWVLPERKIYQVKARRNYWPKDLS